MPKSTILIETSTRERLKEIGRKGQTYDELINHLLKASTTMIEPARGPGK